jgi:hypothetical protein
MPVKKIVRSDTTLRTSKSAPKQAATKIGGDQIFFSVDLDEDERRLVRRRLGKDGVATDTEVQDWLLALLSTHLTQVRLACAKADKQATAVLAMMAPNDPRRIVEAIRLGGDQTVHDHRPAYLEKFHPWIARLFDVDPCCLAIDYLPRNDACWALTVEHSGFGVFRAHSFLELLSDIARVGAGLGKWKP